MALENTWGNSNKKLEVHIKQMKEKFNGWPKGLGLDRIRAIRAALVVSIDELQAISNILHKNFVSQIDPTSVCTVLVI